jgi:uncharacterized MAPEG superfamily protein
VGWAPRASLTTPLWCLVIVALLPYALAGVGGHFRTKQFGSIENQEPRTQYMKLTGAGARAWAAQLNAWEALGLFTAAVVVTSIAHADPAKVALASLVFVATRVLQPILYVAGLATLRSIDVVIGLLSCIYMFVLAAKA